MVATVAWRTAQPLKLSWPGLSRPSTSSFGQCAKTWMPGTRPGMTTVSLASVGGSELKA